MSIHETVIPLYKPLGKTPLETINALRNSDPVFSHSAMSYAGRLDPMADGLLLALSGDALSKQEALSNLDKSYDAVVLFGISTDSDDLLGMPARDGHSLPAESRMREALQSFAGVCTLPVPVYASVRVQGKPLYWWARNKKLDDITIPSRTTRINAIDAVAVGSTSFQSVLARVREAVPLVSGDFRQTEIIQAWQALAEPREALATVSFSVSCTSGTYIRSLARELGNALGSRALLYSLTRTSIGQYSLENARRAIH